jgi:ABC-type multidrug transport system permease subunit
MKTGKIIKKNIKLLLRSRVSTLVLIFGPLLVILLVGFSFSTSSFNLNMAVFSGSYSELSNSLIEKLKSDNYGVTKYDTENLCIESVKEGQSHACVIFPPDLKIESQGTNTIKFYVDQSKINLVYLVMSSLEGSVSEKSTEISKDLTGKIVASLLNTKTKIGSSLPLINDIKTEDVMIVTAADNSIDSLDSLDLTTGSKIAPDTRAGKVKNELDKLLSESSNLVDEGLEIIPDLKDWVESNGTAYLNDLEDKLNEINSTLKTKHNTTAKELSLLSHEINESFNNIYKKLDNAKNVNTGVLAKLNIIKDNADALKQKSEILEKNLQDISADVSTVKVTDTENIVSPITTEINPIVKEQTNLGFLFPSLIVMLIMFIGLLLPSTLIIMEKNSKAYFRVFTTPTKNRLFVAATYLTSMILIFFQVMIILLVSQFFFKINFMNSFFMLFMALIIIMTFFILLGMLIGYVINTEEMAMLASVSVGTLFLLTSGIIFPLESMPLSIVEKARFNPVVLGSEVFKKSLLFGADFNSIKTSFGYLLLFSLVLIIIILSVRKADKFQFLLKKPTRMKIKKDFLISQFDFGERKAKSLAEFIVSIQNLNEDKFQALLKQSCYSDWLLLAYNNRYLAKKTEALKSKQEIVKILVEELKKISEKK